MPSPTRVLVIDSCRLFCEGLQRILPDDRFAVIAAGDDATHEAAVEIDLVVCSLTDELALSRLHRIRTGTPTVKCVVFTDNASASLITRALELGVDAFLSKDISTEVLQCALELVMLGQQLVPTPLVHSLLDRASPGTVSARPELTRSDPSGEQPITFSGREAQILRYLVNGCSNKGIARELNIPEMKVKVYLKGLMRKIRATNRTQAAIWALSHPYELEQERRIPAGAVNGQPYLERSRLAS